MDYYEEFKEEYLSQFGNKIATLYLGMEIPECEIKLYYYIDYYRKYPCKIVKYKDEIREITKQIIENVYNDDSRYYLFLDAMKLLQLISESKEYLIELDRQFYIKVYYNILECKDDFWEKILNFLRFRKKYYDKINIEVWVSELKNLKKIFIRKRKELNEITAYYPHLFLELSNYYFYYYERVACSKEECGYYGMNILLMCVTYCKNNNLMKEMSNYIYQLEKLRTSLVKSKKIRIKRYIFDIMCGYGEKPLRLLIVYFILAIIFTFIYSLIPGISKISEMTGFDRIVSSLYFYNTTSLTIGYGDIQPLNSIAMIIVMLNQTLGFIIGGSFISLYLRKIFRY